MNSIVRSEGGTDNVRKLVNGEMAVKYYFHRIHRNFGTKERRENP